MDGTQDARDAQNNPTSSPVYYARPCPFKVFLNRAGKENPG
jgi:hypothetical protein